MYGEERGQSAVPTGQLPAYQAGRGGTNTRTAIAFDGRARDVEGCDLGEQLERELLSLPVTVNNRDDIPVAEGADPVADVTLLFCQEIVEQEVVRPEGQRWVNDHSLSDPFRLASPGTSGTAKGTVAPGRCPRASRRSVGRPVAGSGLLSHVFREV